MELPTSKYIKVNCKSCQQEKIIETKFNHFCSPECAHQSLLEYWRKKWPTRKLDPKAKEHARRAAQRYRLKKKENKQ